MGPAGAVAGRDRGTAVLWENFPKPVIALLDLGVGLRQPFFIYQLP